MNYTGVLAGGVLSSSSCGSSSLGSGSSSDPTTVMAGVSYIPPSHGDLSHGTLERSSNPHRSDKLVVSEVGNVAELTVEVPLTPPKSCCTLPRKPPSVTGLSAPDGYSVTDSFPGLKGGGCYIVYEETNKSVSKFSALFPGVVFNCYYSIKPYIETKSAEAWRVLNAFLPTSGPIVAKDFGLILSYLVFAFDLGRVRLPHLTDSVIEGYRFIHFDSSRMSPILVIIAKLLVSDGFVGAGKIGGVDPVNMVNVAATVGATTIAANDASLTYRGTMQALVPVTTMLDEDEMGIIRKERHARFLQNSQVANGHALMAAWREIIRYDLESVGKIKTTEMRTLVLGATDREFRNYSANTMVHFQLANREGKDTTRMVTSFLNKVRKNKSDKANRTANTINTRRRAERHIDVIDNMLHEFRKTMKIPQRIVLWDETEKLFNRGVMSDGLEPPEEDPDLGIIDTFLDQFGRKCCSIGSAVSDGYYWLLPSHIPDNKDKCTYDQIVFEDVGYNFTKWDWYKIFRATNAVVAYGYMCLPWELTFPGIVEQPGYRYRVSGKFSFLGYEGPSNGYRHRTDAWKTLLTHTVLDVRDLSLGVEIMARAGPMACLKIYRMQRNDCNVRRLGLPNDLKSVQLLNIRQSTNNRTGDLVMGNLIYFPVRINEFQDALNYAIDIAKESLNFRNIMMFIRRRCNGMSLVNKELTTTWTVDKALIGEMAEVVYLVALARLSLFEKFEKKITTASISPCANFFEKMWYKATTPFTNFIDFFRRNYDYEKILVKGVDEQFWQETMSKCADVKKAVSRRIYLGENPEDMLDQNYNYDECVDDNGDSACTFCDELFLCMGCQDVRCDRDMPENYYHTFALTNEELKIFREKLVNTEKDPIGLKTIKEKALSKVPPAAFSENVRVQYICGPPGTGKSYIIRGLAKGDDIVVAPFSRLKEDYIDFIHPVTGKTTSLKFYTQHNAFEAMNHKRIFVDEFTAMPYECLAIIVHRCAATEVILVGDDKQTGIMNEVEGITITSKIDVSLLRQHELVKNFRNPSDAVAVLNTLYGYAMEATNTRLGFVFDRISNFHNYDTNIYTPLFFRHASGDLFGYKQDTIEKITIRSNQGATYDNVLLVVTNGDQKIFDMPSMAIVALSRHRYKCVILSEEGVSDIFASMVHSAIPEGLIPLPPHLGGNGTGPQNRNNHGHDNDDTTRDGSGGHGGDDDNGPQGPNNGTSRNNSGNVEGTVHNGDNLTGSDIGGSVNPNDHVGTSGAATGVHNVAGGVGGGSSTDRSRNSQADYGDNNNQTPPTTGDTGSTRGGTSVGNTGGSASGANEDEDPNKQPPKTRSDIRSDNEGSDSDDDDDDSPDVDGSGIMLSKPGRVTTTTKHTIPTNVSVGNSDVDVDLPELEDIPGIRRQSSFVQLFKYNPNSNFRFVCPMYWWYLITLFISILWNLPYKRLLGFVFFLNDLPDDGSDSDDRDGEPPIPPIKPRKMVDRRPSLLAQKKAKGKTVLHGNPPTVESTVVKSSRGSTTVRGHQSGSNELSVYDEGVSTTINPTRTIVAPKVFVPPNNGCLIESVAQLTGEDLRRVWSKFIVALGTEVHIKLKQQGGLSIKDLEKYCNFHNVKIRVYKEGDLDNAFVTCGTSGEMIGSLTFIGPEKTGHFQFKDKNKELVLSRSAPVKVQGSEINRSVVFAPIPASALVPNPTTGILPMPQDSDRLPQTLKGKQHVYLPFDGDSRKNGNNSIVKSLEEVPVLGTSGGITQETGNEKANVSSVVHHSRTNSQSSHDSIEINDESEGITRTSEAVGNNVLNIPDDNVKIASEEGNRLPRSLPPVGFVKDVNLRERPFCGLDCNMTRQEASNALCQMFEDFSLKNIVSEIQALGITLKSPLSFKDSVKCSAKLRWYQWFLQHHTAAVYGLPETIVLKGPPPSGGDDPNKGNSRDLSKNSSGKSSSGKFGKFKDTLKRKSAAPTDDVSGKFARYLPNWVGGNSKISISLPQLSVVEPRRILIEPLAGASESFLEMARLFTNPIMVTDYLVEQHFLDEEPHHPLEQSPYDAYKMLYEDFATNMEHQLMVTNEESLNYLEPKFGTGLFDKTRLDNLNPRGHPKKNKQVAWSILAVAPGVTYFKDNTVQALACLQARYLTSAMVTKFNHESIKKANEIADLFYFEHMHENFDIFNEQDIWATTMESERAMKIKNYEAQVQFDVGGETDVRFTMKDIFKPIKTKLDIFKAGQGISAWSKDTQTIFQTAFRVINKHFINCLLPHVVYDNGIDEVTLMNRVNALFLELPGVCVNGVIDATACDSGQNRFTQHIERRIMERMGIQKWFLDWYYSFREEYVLKGYGVTAKIKDIKTSGEPATLFNNTTLMAVLMNYLIRGEGPCVLVIKGDDGLKRQANLVYDESLKEGLRAYLKMDFKVDIDVPITFCGYFLYKSYLLPDLQRKVFKILGHRFRDYEHFSEYQESLRDWILNVNKIGIMDICKVTSMAYNINLEYCYDMFHAIVSLSHIGRQQFEKFFTLREYDWGEDMGAGQKWVEKAPWYSGFN